jgi:hypothetical protein
MPQWSLEENEVNLLYGDVELHVAVRKPLDPDCGPPDMLVMMKPLDQQLAYYMILDEETVTKLAERVEELRWQLHDRRPVYGCHRKDIRPLSLSAIDASLSQWYAPARAEAIRASGPLIEHMPPAKRPRFERLRAWWADAWAHRADNEYGDDE